MSSDINLSPTGGFPPNASPSGAEETAMQPSSRVISPSDQDDILESIQFLFKGPAISIDHYERAYHTYVKSTAGTSKLEFRNLINFVDAHTLVALPRGSARSSLIEAKLALDELTEPGVELAPEHRERLTEMQLLGTIGLASCEVLKTLKDTGTEEFQRLLELTAGTLELGEIHGAETLASGLALTAAASTLLLGFRQGYSLLQSRSKPQASSMQTSSSEPESLDKKKEEAALSLYIGSTRFSTEMIGACAKVSAAGIGTAAGFKILLGAGLVVAGAKAVQESLHKIKAVEKEIEKLTELSRISEPASPAAINRSPALKAFISLRGKNLHKQLCRDGWLRTLAGATSIIAGIFNVATGIMGIVSVAAGIALMAAPVGWIFLGSLVTGLLIGCLILYLHPAKCDSIRKAYVEYKLNKLTQEINTAHLQDTARLPYLRDQQASLEKELEELKDSILKQKADDPTLYDELTKNLTSSSLDLDKEEFTPFIGDTRGLDEKAFRRKVLEAVSASS